MKAMILIDTSPMEPDELDFRWKVLRDSIICMGWVKLMTIPCCVVLYFLVCVYSIGHISDILQIMILVITIPRAVQAILLFYGAMENKRRRYLPPSVLNAFMTNNLYRTYGNARDLNHYYKGMQEKFVALDVALWLGLILGLYYMVLGIMGAFYFINNGHLTTHFLLAAVFGLNVLYLYAVICHDVPIIYAYKKMLIMKNSDF